MQLDGEAVQMPQTFSIQARGVPTPGTTHLGEPPEGELPPPPAIYPPLNPFEELEYDAQGFRYCGLGPRIERAVDIAARAQQLEADAATAEMKYTMKSENNNGASLRCIQALKRTTRNLVADLYILYVHLTFSSIACTHPSTVVLSAETFFPREVSQYHEKHRVFDRRYSLAAFVTANGELDVDDEVSRRAVIDSGASSIVVGRDFAAKLLRCAQSNLVFGDSFTTAGGTKEQSLGRTKTHLTFTLARGTPTETTISAPVIIADTNVYDVLLGMDFPGPLFGYFDPLTSELVRRVDCHNVETIPTRTARLLATCYYGADGISDEAIIYLVVQTRHGSASTISCRGSWSTLMICATPF